MGKGPEHFSKEDIQRAKYIKRLYNITNHKGNGNQNHSEICLMPLKMAVTKKAIVSVGKGVAERVPCTLLVRM